MEILSGLIGAIIGFIGSYLGLRYNYKDLYAKTVTSSRRESNSILRENISIIVASCSLYNEYIKCYKTIQNSFDTNKNYFEIKEKVYKSISICNMMMSVRGGKGNEYHKELEKSLYIIRKQIVHNEIIDEMSIMIIEKMVRCVLDYEWIRIKQEAKGESNV